MASDPYGFPEAAGPGGGPGDAVTSLWAGIAALVMGAIGPCLCYMPWLVALPLSAVAVYYGTRAQRSPQLSAQGLDHAARAGLVSGGVGLVFSLLYVGVFLIYVIYVVALIGVAVVGEL